jgi:hypothetical protein
MTDEDKVVADYRGLLTQTEQQSQAQYDKTVLALSGGGLGLSFAFIKDVIGAQHIVHGGCLLAAWIGWGLSSTAVLVSFLTSQLALRKAIKQLDREKLKMERPGGLYDLFTAFLNAFGLVLFLFGLGMMIFFLNFNLKIK